jgi:hypothetical protein
MDANPLYEAARDRMPALRYTPTDPTLYTCFAVAGDACGCYHLLSHYRSHLLFYIRVRIEHDALDLDLTFKRDTDDLFFFGCQHLGELIMRPPHDPFDFAWYRESLRQLFGSCITDEPNRPRSLPEVFRVPDLPSFNGPVIVRLAQSIRHRKLPEHSVPAPLHYAF